MKKKTHTILILLLRDREMKNLRDYLNESVFDGDAGAVVLRGLDKFLHIYDCGHGLSGVCPEFTTLKDGVLEIDVPNNVIDVKLHFDQLPKFIKEIKIICSGNKSAVRGQLFLGKYDSLPIPIQADWWILSIETDAPKLDMGTVVVRDLIDIKSKTCKSVKLVRPEHPEGRAIFKIDIEMPMLGDARGLKDVSVTTEYNWGLNIIRTKLGRSLTRLRNKEIRAGKDANELAQKIMDMFGWSGQLPFEVLISWAGVENDEIFASGTIRNINDKARFA